MKSVIATITLIAITIVLIIVAILPLARSIKGTGETAYSIVQDMNNNLAEPSEEP